MDDARPTLADALASHDVAGTLRGRARACFEALLPSHPARQNAVHERQVRLMPLTTVIAPAAPPAAVWKGTEGKLWPAQASAQAPA